MTERLGFSRRHVGFRRPPADALLAFCDGAHRRTGYTLARALVDGLAVKVVHFEGITRPPRASNPEFIVLGAYRSARHAERDPASAYVRRLVARRASPEQHRRWGLELAALVAATTRRRFTVVVPIPPSQPGTESSLAQIVRHIARKLGAADGTGLLARVPAARRRGVRRRRIDLLTGEHSHVLSVDRTHPAFDQRMRVLFVDSVIVTGDTMQAAVEALHWDAPEAHSTGAAFTGALE